MQIAHTIGNRRYGKTALPFVAPMSQLASLGTLPQELVDHIISLVDSTTAIVCLTQVCKSLKAAAEPVLYRSVAVRPQGRTSLTNALDSDPQRLTWIRKLFVNFNIECQSSFADEGEYFIPAGVLGPWILKMASLQELKIESTYWEFNDLENENWADEEVAFLHGRFNHPKLLANIAEPFLLNSLSTSPSKRIFPFFTHCHLHFSHANQKMWNLMNDEMFLSPTLKSISLIRCDFHDGDFERFGNHEVYEAQTALEDLRLSSCFFNYETFRKVFSFPRGLKHLYLDQAERCRPFETYMTANALIETIAQQKDTLESLHFLDAVITVDDSFLTSFDQFPKIHTLTLDLISSQNLLDLKLPTNLKTLRLNVETEIEVIRCLIESKVIPPSLRKLIIPVRLSDPDAPPPPRNLFYDEKNRVDDHYSEDWILLDYPYSEGPFRKYFTGSQYVSPELARRSIGASTMVPHQSDILNGTNSHYLNQIYLELHHSNIELRVWATLESSSGEADKVYRNSKGKKSFFDLF